MTMVELIYMADGYRRANDPEEIKRHKVHTNAPSRDDIDMLMRRFPDDGNRH